MLPRKRSWKAAQKPIGSFSSVNKSINKTILLKLESRFWRLIGEEQKQIVQWILFSKEYFC